MTMTTPKDFICPITKVLMKDPVEAPHGVSYERAAIVEWLGKHECCPVIGFPLEASELRTNTKLQWKIRYWLLSNSEAEADNTKEEEEERRPLDKFVCPLTNSIMADPVTTREGHNYEREALEKFVSRHGSISPFSGKPLGQPEFYANKKLAWEIKNWQTERPATTPEIIEQPKAVAVEAQATTTKTEAAATPKMHTITIPGSKVPAEYSSQRSSMLPPALLNETDTDKDVLSILDEVCQLELSV